MEGPDPLTPPQGRPGAHCIGGWVGPKAGSGGYRKSCSTRVGTVNHPLGTMWMFLSVPVNWEQ